MNEGQCQKTDLRCCFNQLLHFLKPSTILHSTIHFLCANMEIFCFWMIIKNVPVYLLMWSTTESDPKLALFERNSICQPLCHNTFCIIMFTKLTTKSPPSLIKKKKKKTVDNNKAYLSCNLECQSFICNKVNC